MALNDETRNRVEEQDEIKVTDRRMFRADGELRELLAEDPDSGQESTEQQEPESSDRQDTSRQDTSEVGGFEHRPVEEPEGVDFTMLINAMVQPALIFLGEIPHPGTGKPEINLEQARLQIDLLDVLRNRCRGNLTPEEEGLLERMLYQLRMLCVTRAGQPDR